MVYHSCSSGPRVVLVLFFSALLLIAWGCGGDANNDMTSLSSGTTTGGGGSGLAPATIRVTAGNRELAAGGFTTTLTVIVTDKNGARTDATFYLTSSLGGNFIIDSDKKGGTIVGTTNKGIFITTFESGVLLGDTEIAAFIPGTALRGTTIITLV